MQAVLPPDIHVSYEFDQSPYVTRAIWGVVGEGALGAVLVGPDGPAVPARLAKRDHRAAEHPAGADGGRGGALAHRADDQPDDPGRAGPGHRHPGGRGDRGDREHPHARWAMRPRSPGRCGWATPRPPSRGCWPWSASWPCSFRRSSCRARRGRCSCPCRWPSAFSMVASYLLSSTFVPVLSVWLLRHVHLGGPARSRRRPPASPAAAGRNVSLGLASAFSFDRFRARYEWLLARLVRFRWVLVAAYLAVSAAIIWGLGSRLGTEIFPTIDTGQFRLRIRAPDGTHIDRTEQIVLQGPGGHPGSGRGRTTCEMTLGYLGTIASSLPDQRRVSMDAGAGRRRDVGGLEAAKRHPRRAVQRGTPRTAGRRRCRACISPSSRPTSSTR